MLVFPGWFWGKLASHVGLGKLVSMRTGIVQITSMDVSLSMLVLGKTNIACWFGYAGFYENEHR